MFLTKEKIDLISKLADEKGLHPENLITPSEEEAELMQIIRKDMTLDDYLSLPETEQRKWFINYNHELKEVFCSPLTNSKGEEIYFEPYYFEPWHPDIFKRIY